MPLSEVRGQDQVTEALRRAFAQGRSHHAYLLHGLEGVGKRLIARCFAQLLLCRAPETLSDGLPDACGRCSACARVKKAFDPRESAGHPDLSLIEREGLREAEAARLKGELSKGSVKTKIGVEAVREVIQKLSMSAYEGGRRVVYLEEVELLQPQAANAFLKTLEEPGEGVYFLMTTRQPKGVLNTILSRSQQLRCAPLSVEVMRALLLNPERAGGEVSLSYESAHTLAQLSGGSMAEAEHWLMLELDQEGELDHEGRGGEGGGAWEQALNRQLLSVVRSFDLSGGAEALLKAWEASKTYEPSAQQQALRRLLSLLRAWYRDVMIFKELERPPLELLTYQTLREESAARAQVLSAQQVRWRLQALQSAERDLFERQGANRALTLSALAMYLSGFDAVINEPLYPS